ncbi:MAG: aldo/keto reductase [Bacteroidota bacterium]
MQYRFLGNTGLRVSELSLGCMSLGKEPAAAHQIIRLAHAEGINLFDTADLYDQGLNERIVGSGVAPFRKDILLASKVGNEWLPDGSTWRWNPRKDYIFSAIEKSLKRLGTDYLDLYQLHGGQLEDPWDEIIEAFERLKERGLIRYYGISSIRPNVIRKWTEIAGPSSLMTQYSLLDRRPEEANLKHLANTETGLIVRGAVAKGYLLGKAPKDYLGHTLEAVASGLEQMGSITEDVSLLSMALGYVLQEPAVSTIALGASRQAQLAESLSAYAQLPLSRDVYEALAEIFPAFRYEKHH